MTTLPKICQKSPYPVKVEEGKQYSWCSCGLSSIQPFCDGKHKGNSQGLKSVKYIAEKTQTIYFCGCKHSKDGVFCDGSHGDL